MECQDPFQESSEGTPPAGDPGKRVVVTAEPGFLRVEIRPLVRTSGARLRLAVAAAVLLGSTLFGAARVGETWEIALKRGDFGDLPLPLLVALTIAVGIFTPLAFVGLAALSFAEETVEVGSDLVTITTTTFEKTRVRRIPLAEIECWRETFLPLSPWWTWAVERLAARRGGGSSRWPEPRGPRRNGESQRSLPKPPAGRW